MVEPVQGEGGVHPPCPSYMNQLRDICDRHDLLLILDEIQTGNGRTGAFFAYQHANILPDVVTTAKGLGNGAPIGVCLTHGKAATLFKPGNHGSTFGGNPMVCAAALATLNTIENENLIARAASLGESLMTRFKEELADCDNVVEVRGKGLMIGIELKDPGANITAKALDNGVLILLTAGNTVRLLPPLNLSDEEAEQLVSMVVKTIKA
jgi:acetylornithine/N-succinyldiaminopimelate aminotransferase